MSGVQLGLISQLSQERYEPNIEFQEDVRTERVSGDFFSDFGLTP